LDLAEAEAHRDIGQTQNKVVLGLMEAVVTLVPQQLYQLKVVVEVQVVDLAVVVPGAAGELETV
jgi:hypothetical protein